jgi:4-amino-4-deoxy-L-arabinose transferase-like glycosyltransferase
MRWRARGAIDQLSSLRLGAWAGVFGVAALIVRLPFFFGTHHSVLPDEPKYLKLADGLLHGSFAGEHFWTPGYPVVEATLGLLPGRTQDAVIVTQHLLGIAVVMAVVLAAGRYFGKPAALMAGALAALSPILVIHEHTMLPDFLFGVLLLTGGLILAEAIRRDPVSVRLLVATGVTFGIATWLKSAGQPLFLSALPALLFATHSLRRAVIGTAVVGLALLVTISPWIVRNAVKFDLYSMSNQPNETLFFRAFDVDGLPIPVDQKYGPFAEAIRKRRAAEPPEVRIRSAIAFEFHYGLTARGVSDDDARAAEGNLAKVAIRRHPGRYLTNTVREFGRGVQKLDQFTGDDRVLGGLDLTRPPVGSATTTAIWNAARPVYDVWWLLSLSLAAGLLALFAGPRRSRNAAAALISVWLVVLIGTAFGHGADWRYSAQLAPITWILASAGISILVSAVLASAASVRSARGRAAASPEA